MVDATTYCGYVLAGNSVFIADDAEQLPFGAGRDQAFVRHLHWRWARTEIVKDSESGLWRFLLAHAKSNPNG